MIFMNCSVRSSRVTGPKIRVVIGAFVIVQNQLRYRHRNEYRTITDDGC